jgi:hypothetical protein
LDQLGLLVQPDLLARLVFEEIQAQLGLPAQLDIEDIVAQLAQLEQLVQPELLG